MQFIQPLSHYTHSRQIMDCIYDDYKVNDYITYRILDTDKNDKLHPSKSIRTLEDFSYTSHDCSIFY